MAVLAAMMGSVLFGFAALAIDIGYWEVLRNRAQAAADQAALAAAVEIVAGGTQASGQLGKQALAVAATMGMVNGTNGATVVENSPPSQGAYTSNSNAVEVIITLAAPQFFSQIVGARAPVLTSRAVAVANRRPTCVLALATSGKGVQTGGNGDISLTGCDLDVNSSASNALFVPGSGNVTALDMNIVGNYTTTGNGQVSANGGSVNVGTKPTADPYGSYSTSSLVAGYPNPVCSTTISSSGQVVLPSSSPSSPYVICGTSTNYTWNIPSTTINPGVYVLSGLDFSVGSNVTLTANGVTFIFLQQWWQSGSISYFQVGAGSSVTWSAPSTGASAGLAFWVDRAAPAGTDSFTGGSNTNLIGAVYAPNDTLTYYGNATVQGCTQVIASYIVLQGDTQLLHNACAGTGVIDPTDANILAKLTE